MKRQFPELKIPDFIKLSKSASWNPKLYSPMAFDEKIKKLAEKLKPGTLEYDDFWDEMDYYCYHGFQPKGMPRISGRHFYYLNFNRIKLLPKGKRNKVLAPPNYRDLDHWVFLEIECAEKNGYGLILAKPRQIGLSEIGAINANYTMTFNYLAEVSVAAGKDDKVQEFKEKLESSLRNVHPAYRNKIETNNDKLLEVFFNDTINKQKIVSGINTKARFKTMFADSGAFEGINNNKLAIFEEAGLFENIAMSFKATEPSFRSGNIQYGLPLVYGTGGEVDKGAKGYKEMWDKSDSYNLKRIFIPAYFFYPGDGVPDEKTGKTISFFNYEKGVTDREAAKKFILRERKIAEQSKDTYIKHIQSYPLIAEEVFLKAKGGILDLAKLNFQLKEISMGAAPEPVIRGKYEWVDTPQVTMLLQRAKNVKEKVKIRIANGSTVKFVADDEGLVIHQGSPINKSVEKFISYKPDIGGCDSYDEEVDTESETVSSGCVMIYRCFSGPIRDYNYPVAVVTQRGDASFDDDLFYENAVMCAIYWDAEILFEYTKFHILRYFYDVEAHDYVRGRPDIDGTENHKNKDGVKMDVRLKAILVKLLKAEVRDHIHKCFISPIILDLIKFGDGNTDIAMTLGLCLIHRMDLFEEITEDIENGNAYHNGAADNVRASGSYYVDTNGKLQVNTYSDNKIQSFIPERDLSKHDYEQYIQQKEMKNTGILQRRSEFESQAADMGVDVSLYELIKNENEKWMKS